MRVHIARLPQRLQFCMCAELMSTHPLILPIDHFAAKNRSNAVFVYTLAEWTSIYEVIEKLQSHKDGPVCRETRCSQLFQGLWFEDTMP